MPACEIHENHRHLHGANCGHTAIQHDDHVDYLHDGHLHHLHEGHVDEHTPLTTSAALTKMPMSTAPAAATRRSRTAITRITLSPVICTTRMATTATTTALSPCCLPNFQQSKTPPSLTPETRGRFFAC